MRKRKSGGRNFSGKKKSPRTLRGSRGKSKSPRKYYTGGTVF